MMLVEDKSSVAIKKGKSDGIIEFINISNPVFAEYMLFFENTTKDIVKNKSKTVKKLFLKKIIKFLIFFIDYLLID